MSASVAATLPRKIVRRMIRPELVDSSSGEPLEIGTQQFAALDTPNNTGLYLGIDLQHGLVSLCYEALSEGGGCDGVYFFKGQALADLNDPPTQPLRSAIAHYLNQSESTPRLLNLLTLWLYFNEAADRFYTLLFVEDTL